jgi:endonuclease G
MTNRHVAEIFSVPDGSGGWEIMANPFTGQPQEISINFAEDHCGSPASFVRVTQIFHIEPEPGPDVALLRVEGELPPALPLQEDALAAAGLPNRNVYVAGYPFNDSRNPLWARLEVFGNIYGVKRLAPGQLQELSGQPIGDGNTYLLHDSSTLGGNSGSPIVDLESNRVIGLHFSGSFQEANFAWPMWRILDIPAVRRAILPDGGEDGANTGGEGSS